MPAIILPLQPHEQASTGRVLSPRVDDRIGHGSRSQRDWDPAQCPTVSGSGTAGSRPPRR